MYVCQEINCCLWKTLEYWKREFDNVFNQYNKRPMCLKGYLSVNIIAKIKICIHNYKVRTRGLMKNRHIVLYL